MTILKSACKSYSSNNLQLNETTVHKNVDGLKFDILEKQVKDNQTLRVAFTAYSAEKIACTKGDVQRSEVHQKYIDNFATID